MFINHSGFLRGMANVLAFNRWSVEGIKVNDPGVAPYISLNSVVVPKTGARYAGNKFHKSKIFIVERLINKLMVTGHKGKKHFISSGNQTGKAHTVYDLVEKAFEIVETKTKQNPVAVFVKAIENAAPREEIVTIEYGGARYPKAVECAPQRRIDMVLRLFAQGAKQKSFNNRKPYEVALADEIIAAAQLSPNSLAVSKKLELERQADASR
jgi:small subunit ribosomal protein S7